jgi:hypothetical protein
MSRSTPRSIAFPVGLTVFLLGVAACSQNGTSSAGRQPPAVTKSDVLLGPDMKPAIKVASLSGTTSDLAFDERRNAMWFVDRADDGVSLVRVEGSQVARRVGLTGAHEPTVTEHVRVSPDGSIWITDGYQVSRVDPETDTVRTVTLPLEVDGMAAGATDTGNPWAGTWLSAITFDSRGSAILARLNVPALQVMSAELQTTGWIPLPADGQRIGDAVLTTAGLNWVSLEDGTSRTEPPTVRLLPLVLPEGITPPLSTNPVDAILRDPTKGSNDPAVATIKGSTLTANSHSGIITQAEPGGVSRIISLPRNQEEIGAPDGNKVYESEVPVPVLALTLGADNAVWLVSRHNGVESLYRLD